LKEPQRMVCRWNDNEPSGDDPDLPPDYKPTPACPLVFHLFGNVTEYKTLVLTEDDYLDFLIRTSEKKDPFPQAVQRAMKNDSLLFFGYKPNDLDFRVVTRTLYRVWQYRPSSSGGYVQMIHVGDDKLGHEQIALLTEYCKRYYRSISIRVYLG